MDLPLLVLHKITIMLDVDSLINASQVCKKFQQIVSSYNQLSLELPNTQVSKNLEIRRKKVLRIKLNLFGSHLARNYGYLLGLEEVVSTLRLLNTKHVLYVCIDIEYDALVFDNQVKENYANLLFFLREMRNVRKFKLIIRRSSQDTYVIYNHVKYIKDCLACITAKEVILKLPVFSTQQSCRLQIPANVAKLVIIGPCFGISTKKTLLKKLTGILFSKFAMEYVSSSICRTSNTVEMFMYNEIKCG